MVRAQRGQNDPTRSEAKRSREDTESAVGFLIHRGVNPGGRDAPGCKPLAEPVQLVVFHGCSGSPAVFCDPLTGPVRSGLVRLAV